MKTIFMNTGNSKINESSKFIYQFTDKFNSNTPNNKNFGLVNLSFYYAWKNIKSAYNNNQFKMPAPIWNDTFHLPDGSYPSNLQCHHSYGIEDSMPSFNAIILFKILQTNCNRFEQTN